MFIRSYPDGLKIRPPRPEDGPQIFEYFTHPDVARTTLSHPANEYETTAGWLDRQNETQHRFLAIMENRPVGTIGLHVAGQPRKGRQGSLGLMVHPDYWGRGIASRLIEHILELADNWLNLARVELEVFDHNERAVKLYERLGFVREGRRERAAFGSGRHLNELLMGRLRPAVDQVWTGPLPRLEQTPATTLSSEVTVRPLAAADLEDIYEIWLHPDIWGPNFELPSLEFVSARDRVRKSKAADHRMVAVTDEKVVGLGTLSHRVRNPRRGHSADMNLVVHPAYQRQGVGTKLGQALLDVGENWLNLKRISTKILTGNEAALALANRLGFEQNAVSRRVLFGYGQWHDVAIMSRLNDVPQVKNFPVRANISPLPRQPLQGEIQVRAFHVDDIPAMYQLFSHPLIANTTAQIPSLELPQLDERLHPTSPAMFRFVAEMNGEILGMCSIYQWDLKRQAHGAGLGMMVHPEYWGHGIGSRLLEAVVDLADNWLGLRRIDLEVTTDNPAGIALYHKYGFQHEGIIPYYLFGNGRWAHVHVMSRWH